MLFHKSLGIPKFGGHFVFAKTRLKTQNFAREPGSSNSAYPNYAKKCGSQLVLKNALNVNIS